MKDGLPDGRAAGTLRSCFLGYRNDSVLDLEQSSVTERASLNSPVWMVNTIYTAEFEGTGLWTLHQPLTDLVAFWLGSC